HRRDDGGNSVTVILDGTAAELEAERQRLTEAAGQAAITAVEVVDRVTWESIRRLVSVGVIRLTEAGEVLHRSPILDRVPSGHDQAARMRKRQAALDWLGQAERKLRMATL